MHGNIFLILISNGLLMTQDQEESRKICGRKRCQRLTAHKLQTQTRVEEVPKNLDLYNVTVLNLLFCLHVGLEEFTM